jgi:hypothetical protein
LFDGQSVQRCFGKDVTESHQKDRSAGTTDTPNQFGSSQRPAALT